MRLRGKKILLGISGGIAAYKSLTLIRLLIKEGAEVRVVCTAHALEFVTPLTLETLSQNPVYTDLFQPVQHRTTLHISHAEWADAILIAPATANLIGKLAHGIADDALTTLFLSLHKKLSVLSPSMNVNMYENPVVQANMELLRQRGCRLIEPEEGFLACGAEAKGRMPEPEHLLESFVKLFYETCPDESASVLKGRKILLTAGPTVENIDPVRYISNRSTGLMGYSISDVLVRKGAEVYLVNGPTSLQPALEPFHRIQVQTAEEMFQAATGLWEKMDIGILTAAVADYRPVQVAEKKIKKQSENMTVVLESTPDILKTLGMRKTSRQFLVGFALETHAELENAQSKLKRKNADMIVLNSLQDAGAGFEKPTNKVTILDAQGGVFPYDLKSKAEVAEDIVKRLEQACSK